MPSLNLPLKSKKPCANDWLRLKYTTLKSKCFLSNIFTLAHKHSVCAIFVYIIITNHTFKHAQAYFEEVY